MRSRSYAGCAGLAPPTAKHRWGTRATTDRRQHRASTLALPPPTATPDCSLCHSTGPRARLPQTQAKIPMGCTQSPKTLTDHAQLWENGARVSPWPGHWERGQPVEMSCPVTWGEAQDKDFSLPRSRTQTSHQDQNQSKACKVNQRPALTPHERDPCTKSQAMGVCQQPREPPWPRTAAKERCCVPGGDLSLPQAPARGREGRSLSSLRRSGCTTGCPAPPAPTLQQVPVGWAPSTIAQPGCRGRDELLGRNTSQSRKSAWCRAITENENERCYLHLSFHIDNCASGS